jgi:hypothetical protein
MPGIARFDAACSAERGILAATINTALNAAGLIRVQFI